MLLIYALLFVMIFFWGFSFIIVDIALEFVTPLSIAFYRLILASITMILIDLYLSRKKSDKETLTIGNTINKDSERNYWLCIVLASLAGVSLYLFVIYSAISLIGPSLPVLTDCLINPILITILSLFIFKEKLTINKGVGFIVASFGAFLLITGGNIGILQPTSPNFLGYILALLAPLMWSFYAIAIKKASQFSNNRSDFHNLRNISILGCLEFIILNLITGDFNIFLSNLLNPIVFLCALYLGLGAFVIGYYIWNYSLKKLRSSSVASFLYLQPFITLIFSFIFQRYDVIGIWNIIGSFIVILAMIVINYKKQEL
ncbi:MAG: DMT family transporter [Candidatus Lokiarchaeota archaeon]|nr:DMT family transporter [Candidatus Lokiarchaeota archaeon]